MNRHDPPDWSQIPEVPNPLVDLAIAQTAEMDAGKIAPRRESSEPYRCSVCEKLLTGDMQIRMGLCGAHMDEAF